MPKSDLLLIFLTALIGLVVGGYLSVMVFTPLYSNTDTAASNAETRDFQITGEEYGACVDIGCEAFRLSENRDITYFTRAGRTRTGVMPSSEYRTIARWVSGANLQALAAPRNNVSACESPTTTQQQYVIFRDGEEYNLDTCRTALYNDAAAQEALAALFESAFEHSSSQNSDS